MTLKVPGGVNEKALARRVKDHVIGRRHDFFAIVQPGFEAAAEQELRDLGVSQIQGTGTGGIAFGGRLADAYRVNLGAGTLSRLLLRLFHFKARNLEEFRCAMTASAWELHLGDGAWLRFLIHAGGHGMWHSGRVEQEALASIQARLAAYGRRALPAPKNIPEGGREQTVFIRLDRERCLVSLDSSGELLYRRGYGKHGAKAPLRETLACAILRAAAVERYQAVLDPFCGSGTLGLEAGLIFSGRPSNLKRCFAFEAWPSFRPASFAHLKQRLAAEMAAKAIPGKKVFCSDIAAPAVRTTARNLAVMGLSPWLTVERNDFFRLAPPAGIDPAGMLLVLNPPYGTRLGSRQDSAELYRRIGAKIRRDFAGCGYAIVVPGLELEKVLSLPYDEKILFRNGGIPVSLLVHHGQRADVSVTA